MNHAYVDMCFDWQSINSAGWLPGKLTADSVYICVCVCVCVCGGVVGDLKGGIWKVNVSWITAVCE